MARPIGADAAATRTRILSVALRLFAEKGPTGCSIREIAAESHVSLAMVHHYFGSKDELHEAVIEAMYEELRSLRDALRQGLPRASHPEVWVDSAMRAAFRFARSHRVAVQLLLRSVVEEGGLDPARREEALVPYLAEASATLGLMLGRRPDALRLPLQSLVFLTARYAIGGDAEVTALARTSSPRRARAAIEAHLVETARALLLTSPPTR